MDRLGIERLPERLHEDPDTLVIQGNVLDGDTRGRLLNELDGEDAVTIPTETILRAADMIRARQ